MAAAAQFRSDGSSADLDDGIRLLNAPSRLPIRRVGAGTGAPAEREATRPRSDRELPALRLLVTELSGPRIASELVISLDILRTHTKHISEELVVSGRPAAVGRAQQREGRSDPVSPLVVMTGTPTHP